MKLLKALLLTSALAFAQPALAGYANVAIPSTANPTSTFTFPATTPTYAALNLVANNATAGSVTVSSFTATATAACSFDLALIKLSINNTGTGPGTGVDGWNLTLRTWTAAPTYVNGDAAAYRVATGGAGQIGQYTCTLTQYDDAATGMCATAPGWPSSVKLASGSTVYWDLQSNGVVTRQVSKVVTVTPMLKQDAC